MKDTTQFKDIRHFNVQGSAFALYDPDDTVAAETFSPDGYEPAVISLLDKIHEQDSSLVFCDIGALYGYYSALVRSRYSGWIVHAFEPNPVFCEQLQKNFELNSIRGAIHSLALNDVGSSLRFKGRTIVDDNEENSIEVNGATFDEFADATCLSNAILKIDVHGAEGLILNGMKKSLSTVVKDLIIEVHAQHLLVGDVSFEGMISSLEESNMVVYELEGFRDSMAGALVPLKGENREGFVDYSKWQQKHIDRERLIYASARTLDYTNLKIEN